ncbi:hypothetical protein V8G54_009485 [Vigna mungo]|uniref:Uncharacterized protein n=1 Tax=Vigna mungo TaxID=3915 RepID=A0AAQ3S4W9_VIGMU
MIERKKPVEEKEIGSMMSGLPLPPVTNVTVKELIKGLFKADALEFNLHVTALCQKVEGGPDIKVVHAQCAQKEHDLVAKIDNLFLMQHVNHKALEEWDKKYKSMAKEVMAQHKANFQKAWDKVTYLYDIPLNKGRVDVQMAFQKGRLMHVQDIFKPFNEGSNGLIFLPPNIDQSDRC